MQNLQNSSMKHWVMLGRAAVNVKGQGHKALLDCGIYIPNMNTVAHRLELP